MTIPTLASPYEWAARMIRRLPAGRQRVLRHLLPTSPAAPFFARLPTSQSGLQYVCDKTSLMAWDLFCTGGYDTREAALLTGLILPGGTFVDVGANWGYYTLLAAETVGPSGRVVAIEADPRNFARLEQNVERNRLTQVCAIHAAAGRSAGIVELVGFDEAHTSRGVSHVRGTVQSEDASSGRMTTLASATFQVRGDTIDALLDGVGVGRVDLLKMDIEGAEALALPGMRAGLMAGRYRAIAMELHANVLVEYGSDIAGTLGPLREAGFRLWAIEPNALRPIDPSEGLPGRSQFLALAPGEPEPQAGL